MDPLENLIRANPVISIIVCSAVVLGLVAFAIAVLGGRDE